MYLKEVKSVLTQGLKTVFGVNYPIVDFQNLFVTIEYPALEQNYPGIWVGFEPTGNLEKGSINSYLGYAIYDDNNQPDVYSRWRGNGYATFTLGALTSLQRDRLFDELVRVIAFNQESPVLSFRGFVENNSLVSMNLNFDAIAIRGMTENPGTPWGTSEIIYEATLAVESVIEFASDQQGTIVDLTAIDLTAVGPTDNLGHTITYTDTIT